MKTKKEPNTNEANANQKSRLAAGFAYYLCSELEWQGSPDDKWEIVKVTSLVGEKIGERELLGSWCAVVRVGNSYYAQLSHLVSGA